jgi:hypothetical protein
MSEPIIKVCPEFRLKLVLILDWGVYRVDFKRKFYAEELGNYGT